MGDLNKGCVLEAQFALSVPSHPRSGIGSQVSPQFYFVPGLKRASTGSTKKDFRVLQATKLVRPAGHRHLLTTTTVRKGGGKLNVGLADPDSTYSSTQSASNLVRVRSFGRLSSYSIFAAPSLLGQHGRSLKIDTVSSLLLSGHLCLTSRDWHHPNFAQPRRNKAPAVQRREQSRANPTNNRLRFVLAFAFLSRHDESFIPGHHNVFVSHNRDD